MRHREFGTVYTGAEIMVDKNRVSGKGKEIKGAVKETAGKITGNRTTEMKGKGEKIAGKVQGEYGKVKDEVRASQQKSREQPSKTRR